jgi:hypothetical protein
VDRLDVPGRWTLEVVGGHHRVRELAALVRSDVPAAGGGQGKSRRGKDSEHGSQDHGSHLEGSIAGAHWSDVPPLLLEGPVDVFSGPGGVIVVVPP